MHLKLGIDHFIVEITVLERVLDLNPCTRVLLQVKSLFHNFCLIHYPYHHLLRMLFCLLFVVIWHYVSLYNPDWPGIHYPFASVSCFSLPNAEITGVCPHPTLSMPFKFSFK